MDTINIQEAKTSFSKLVQRVVQGEEIVIVQDGIPLAKLVPFPPETGPRKLGIWKGLVHIADDFDKLPDEIAKSFGLSPSGNDS